MSIENFGSTAFEYFGVYAFVVVGMGFIIWRLNKMYTDEKVARDAMADKVVELMTKVADKLPGLDAINDMKRNQVEMMEGIKTNKAEVMAAIKALEQDLKR